MTGDIMSEAFQQFYCVSMFNENQLKLQNEAWFRGYTMVYFVGLIILDRVYILGTKLYRVEWPHCLQT